MDASLPWKPKQQQRRAKHNGQYWAFKTNLSIDIDLSNDFPTSIFIDWLPRGLLADSSSSVFTFLRCPESLGYLWFGVTLLPPQFRSCDYSFGKLRLFCLYIFSCTQLSVTNCTIVTSQMNHHMIWIGWQQGCKHVSRIRLYINGYDKYMKCYDKYINDYDKYTEL